MSRRAQLDLTYETRFVNGSVNATTELNRLSQHPTISDFAVVVFVRYRFDLDPTPTMTNIGCAGAV